MAQNPPDESPTGETKMEDIIGWDQLPEELKRVLSAELRAQIHAIRNELQKIAAQQAVQGIRVDKMEAMFVDHIAAFKESQTEMREVLTLARHIKSGMTITNFLRDAFIGLCGFIAAGYSVWQIFKEMFK